MTEEKTYFNHQLLKKFCIEAFEKVNVTKEDADLVSDTIIKASLRGVDSHGITRLPMYIKRVELGLINPAAQMEIIDKAPSVSLIDVKQGFGQVAAMKAMKESIKKAKKTGVGLVGLKDCNHFGMSAYFAMSALDYNMIGFSMSNATPAIAPWGGTEPMLGTNPIAIAIPAGEELPIVLDMASSVAARGKIRKAIWNKERIPLGWH